MKSGLYMYYTCVHFDPIVINYFVNFDRLLLLRRPAADADVEFDPGSFMQNMEKMFGKFCLLVAANYQTNNFMYIVYFERLYENPHFVQYIYTQPVLLIFLINVGMQTFYNA